MKRVSFALILVLLSFGLSYGLDFYLVPTGGVYGSPDTINTNSAFGIEFHANFTMGDSARLAWSSPFLFYGDNGLCNVDGAGTLTSNPTFQAIWDMGYFTTYKESWDGNLCNNDVGGMTGDLFNVSGIDFSAPHLPNSGSMWLWTVDFPGITTADTTYLGDFCVVQGDAINGTYDWLFEAPVPTFPAVCFPVKAQPDPPPVFDNCPTTTFIGQWSGSFSFDLDGHDLAPVTAGGISFEKVSGPGTVNASTGLWTWQPTCSDVGSHQVVVCVTDANHTCPTGNECTFNVQVNNTPPVISGDCGITKVVGTGSSKTAQFNATDVNGGTLTFGFVFDTTGTGTEVSITQTGLLTFDAHTDAPAPNTYTVTVTVTDCNGDMDQCDIMFEVVGELPFDIVIEKVEGQYQGHHAYVNVTKEAGSEQMWGFDFLIGYDNSALTFISAAQGAGIADWEYFTYRYNWNGNCGGACPTGLLTVTAIADENDGPHHPPAGFGSIADGSVLFTLDFLVSNNYNLQGQMVPIYFYWMQCQDNTIAMHKNTAVDPLEVLTAMALEVYWYNGLDPDLYGGYLLINPPDDLELFPTPYGADAIENPDEHCLDGTGSQNPLKFPVQFIRFFGGGIDIIPVSIIDDRGDINLNGVPNEIADAVVFTNYFIYGPSAFTINFEGQKAATEVNGDGIALTVADLVYLIRVVVGDALPLPAFKPVPTALHVTSGEVNVDNAVGAAHFVFAGDVDVTLAEGANGMELQTNYHDGQTHAILYSFEKGVTANGHVLNSDGQLVSVEAATYDGASYKTTIVPKEFSVKSYPNPFNPVATIEMNLPSASDWTITVFNVVGQRVADFNGHNDAGPVRVQWDASNDASGIYFYKVDAGKTSVTKKMVLLK